MFAKWKDFVKFCSPSTEEELFVAIENGLNRISNEDCEGYYRNMKRYIRLSLQRTNIID
jgi:hypothetical protein